MDPKETTPEVASEVIVCRVTPWYFKRMGITFERLGRLPNETTGDDPADGNRALTLSRKYAR